LFSLFSRLFGDDKPPRPSGDTQPEGSKDRGNSYAAKQLNLGWERESCFESPTSVKYGVEESASIAD